MYNVLKINLVSLALLLTGSCRGGADAPAGAELRDWTHAQLDQRRTDIDRELKTLANYSLRSGTGSIGYRSDFYDDEFHDEWVEIDFRKDCILDEVILVPVIRRDSDNGFGADGFPRNFRLIAGTSDDLEGRLIAEYTDDHDFLPRTAPLVIPCRGITASWIRVEATRLSLRAFDGKYVFQLAEIMAFSGHENIALRKLAHSKSNRRDGLAWATRFLVDGFVPYLMDAADGENSIAFMSRIDAGATPQLTIDLGEPLPVSRLHLHAVDPSDVLPQALSSDFGIPRQMTLEGADKADFSDARELITLNLRTIYKMAPVMMWDFPETTNRFFRLNITAPSVDPRYGSRVPRFGFAEIELLSDGINQALGKPVTGSQMPENPNRPLSRLTDGRNMYGSILSPRDWMKQLARRHDLETERPLVERELILHYEQQKTKLRRLGWLSALLAAGIGATVLINRLLRLREIRGMEQRIAADLHDELGANLHTIGLLSDLAENAKDDPDELSTYHQRIRAVTERSGIAVRNCTNMYSSSALHKGLVADMQRAAQRIMAGLDHELTIEGQEYIERLRQRTRFDLFLFYKECLVNISRHSGATQFSTRLNITPQEISLTVSDNGRGLSDSDGNGIPKSLKRRARLLGAKINIESPQDGGTSIHLKLNPRKSGHFLKRNVS